VSGPHHARACSLNPNSRLSHAPSANYRGADSHLHRQNGALTNSGVDTGSDGVAA